MSHRVAPQSNKRGNINVVAHSARASAHRAAASRRLKAAASAARRRHLKRTNDDGAAAITRRARRATLACAEQLCASEIVWQRAAEMVAIMAAPWRMSGGVANASMA